MSLASDGNVGGGEESKVAKDGEDDELVRSVSFVVEDGVVGDEVTRGKGWIEVFVLDDA